MRDALGQPL
jgi:hypothetical protein